MSEEIMSSFHKHFEEKYSTYRQLNQASYGKIRLKPTATITLAVFTQKPKVEVILSTYGGEKDLPTDDLLKFTEDSGILREEIGDGNFFKVKFGAKNKKKLNVVVSIPYDSLEDINSDEFRNNCSKAIDLILDNKGDVFELSKTRKKSTPEKASKVNELSLIHI